MDSNPNNEEILNNNILSKDLLRIRRVLPKQDSHISDRLARGLLFLLGIILLSIVFIIYFNYLGQFQEVGIIIGLVGAIIIICYFIYSKIRDLKDSKNIFNKLKNTIDPLFKKLEEKTLIAQQKIINQQQEYEDIQNEKKIIKRLVHSDAKDIPWISEIISDFHAEKAKTISNYLRIKKHPAMNASETVKQMKSDIKSINEKYLNERYLNLFYESLFPDLKEYRDYDPDDITETKNKTHDPVNDHLEPNERIKEDEYDSLSIPEKYQVALDNYINRSKSNWQIGRDYERYVGYRYENDGYRVTYFGIEKKLEDLGIDLICKKDDETLIIQCKYWSDDKKIRENAVNQLFGTTIRYAINKIGEDTISGISNIFSEANVYPVIHTKTILSDTARQFAEVLGVKFIENEAIKDYPRIKCHISKESREKLYHLPMDQQYDKTILESSLGEKYVLTVKEAEKWGRRAFRWTGE